MTETGKVFESSSIEEWFRRRSYDHSEFADLERLVRRKRELGLSVSVVLPTREVAATIGAIIDEILALNESAPLADQVIVVDAGSRDGSARAAAQRGVEVYLESELMPAFGPALGKGDAIWRALSVARGDIVLYLDSDTTDFGPQFVYGVLGPLLTVPEVRFAKAAYSRPWRDTAGVEIETSGRVTELTARPLLNIFYPELSGFAQPLAGEMAAPRGLFCSIPFFTGYAVETGMLVDVSSAVGVDAMAQVDLGTRTNENQPLLALSKMAFEVARAVECRLRQDGRLVARSPDGSSDRDRDRYVHAIRSSRSLDLDRSTVEVVERPPMANIANVL